MIYYPLCLTHRCPTVLFVWSSFMPYPCSCLLLTNLLILDLDSQHSRRSAAFAVLCNFLPWPFDSLWIYFMGINKAYSAVLLSALNISGEKEKQTWKHRERKEKPLVELSGLPCVFIPKLWLSELMTSTQIMMGRETTFSMFIRINEHLPQRDGQYFLVLTWLVQSCFPHWEGFLWVCNLMSFRIVCIIIINCSYFNYLLG